MWSGAFQNRRRQRSLHRGHQTGCTTTSRGPSRGRQQERPLRAQAVAAKKRRMNSNSSRRTFHRPARTVRRACTLRRDNVPQSRSSPVYDKYRHRAHLRLLQMTAHRTGVAHVSQVSMSRRRALSLAAGSAVAVPLLLVARSSPAAQNAAMRSALKYQDEPKNGQQCSTCLQWVPGATPKDRGGCKIMPADNEISPAGWCAAWVPPAR